MKHWKVFSQVKVFSMLLWNLFIPPFIFWGGMLREINTTIPHSIKFKTFCFNVNPIQWSQYHIRKVVKDTLLMHQNLILPWRMGTLGLHGPLSLFCYYCPLQQLLSPLFIYFSSHRCALHCGHILFHYPW